MRGFFIIIGFTVGLSTSTGFAKTRVITTSTDLADLVLQVGRDQVEVEAICKGNQDIHYVQARPSFMVKLRRADLVVSIGLDLEIGWLPLLIRGARNPKIQPGGTGHLNLGTFVTPIGLPKTVDASQGHLHPRGNPHYWLDPIRVAALIPTIVKRLSAISPSNAAFFAANGSRYMQLLQSKTGEWKEKMAPYKGTLIISYHDTFNYFYKRYGLVNVDTLEKRPGVPPSPRHLSDVIQKVKEKGIPLLFHELFHDKKPSGLVASRSGATLLILPVSVGSTTESENYISLIDTIVEQFVAVMGKRKK
jgi:zinc/manganese transport system substrate-binding protein